MNGRSEFTVSIRPEYRGRTMKESANIINGKTHWFRYGWQMEADDPYPGEIAWIPDNWGSAQWPEGTPTWIASGDLTDNNAKEV